MVKCTTTAGFKLHLGLGCLCSSGWVKTHRPCTANGSSMLDLAGSFLVYIANRLAVQSCQRAARPVLSVAKREASSKTDCSQYLCFLCKSLHSRIYLAAIDNVRHSKEGSTSASTATLSPVEQQRGFGQLPTINENGPRAGDVLSASTVSMDETTSPTKSQHSWLTNFLVDAHLSAPSRRWEVNWNRAPNAHAGSNSNNHSGSNASMDHA